MTSQRRFPAGEPGVLPRCERVCSPMRSGWRTLRDPAAASSP